MIAAIEKPDRICVVRWIGQVGLLKVVAVSWCQEESNAGDGVLQLPDSKLVEPTPGIRDGRIRLPCSRCKQALGV